MTTGADWQAAVGDAWASEWRRTDRSFAGLALRLDAAIQAAAPAGGGTALDVGCGAGATSLALAAARPDLVVTGVDVNADLLDVARDRAARAGLTNLRFARVDLEQDLPDLPAQDLVCSRHGVMFAADPVMQFARLHAVAAPGASLIFSCFRAVAENPWAGDLVAAVAGGATMSAAAGDYAPGPFAFADPALVGDVLEHAGWHEAAAVPVDFQYVAGAGADPVADAAGFLARIGPAARALRDLADGHDAARARLAERIAGALRDGQVAFPAAAWLWTARA